MQKILLLGATGFIGKNIVDFHFPKPYTLLSVSSKQCNLLSADETKKLVQKIKPQFIIDAAYSGVDSNLPFSKKYLSTNLEMTSNIITACRDEKSIKKVFFIGSGLEYGDRNQPITEDTPINPKNMYATIKAINSLLAVNLAREYDVPLVLLRVFNLYGKYDTKGVVYRLIEAIVENKKVIITEGKQIRDYLYIEDFTHILFTLLENQQKISPFEVINIGSGVPLKMRDLFKIVFTITAKKNAISYIPYRPNDYFHNVANITRLQKMTTPVSITPLEEGLKKTVTWVEEQKKSDG